MKGLKVTFNDQTICASLEKGVLVFTAACYNKEDIVSISGTDRSKLQRIHWLMSHIEIGDKITVEICDDIAENSTPISLDETDRQKELERYYDLKEKLTKRGLL